MYYGPNPTYTPINSTTSLPVVYNICDSWETGHEYYLNLIFTADETLEDAWPDFHQQLTQCSGTLNFQHFTPNSDDSGYVNFAIYEQIATNKYLLAQSDDFLMTIYTPVDQTNNWINWIFENPYYINRDEIDTAYLSFAVKLDQQTIDNYGDICLFSADTGSVKSTTCIPHEDLDPGIRYYSLPIDVPDYDDTEIIGVALWDDTSPSRMIIQSSLTMVVIYSGTSSQDAWTNQFSTSTIGWMGLNSHDMACSEEQWNQESAIGVAICSAKKFGLDIIFMGDTLIRKFFNGILNGIKNIFPFGMMGRINQSWRSSENAVLPADVAWMAPQGDLEIIVPAAWTGHNTTTAVAVFGPGIFQNGDSSIALFFQRIRALTTYLIWGGLVWSIWLFGKRFYYDHFHED